MPIRGNPAVSSIIAPNGAARAVLARTNATVMGEILNALSAGLTPSVIGGTRELKRMLSDVFELKQGKPGTSPEFFGFQNWSEVVIWVWSWDPLRFRANARSRSQQTFWSSHDH